MKRWSEYHGRGPWLGIEPEPPALEASTLPLGYRGDINTDYILENRGHKKYNVWCYLLFFKAMTFIVLDILSYSLLVLIHVKTDEYWDKINEKTYIVLFCLKY